MAAMSVVVYLLVVLLFQRTHGYGTGAPRSSCSTLEPSHSSHNAQRVSSAGASPFTITYSLRAGQQPATAPAGALSYAPSQTFDVTIAVKDEADFFRGFLLQARRASGGREAMGTFGINSRSWTFRETCSDEALTHRNARSKRSVTARWRAPVRSVGDIVFVATFVKEFSIFWEDVRSDVLYDASTVTVPPPTAPAAEVLPGNSTFLCQEISLEPLNNQRPHVAILCTNDAHCPCGWRCCAECDDAVTQMCFGHAICRKPLQTVEVDVVEENRH